MLVPRGNAWGGRRSGVNCFALRVACHRDPGIPVVTDTATEKKALRRRLREAVQAMSPAERDSASLRVCARVLASPLLETAATILLYAPLEGEVDIGTLTEALVALGRCVCLPRADWTGRTMEAAMMSGPGGGLIANRHGVREPGPEAPIVEAARLDAIVVPGVGFDRVGNRLGRGAGFYDRFLARTGGEGGATRPGPRIIGVCFDAQLVDTLPHDELDAPVDAVATPSELLVFGPAPIR